MGISLMKWRSPQRSISPGPMFRVLVFDYDNLISKIIVPKAIQNVELIEGDGGPGNNKKITLIWRRSQIKYVKHKIEAVDEKVFSFNYSLIEGDALMNNLEKISHDINFMAAPDGGSICKISISYHYTICDIYIKEECQSGVTKGLGTLQGS